MRLKLSLGLLIFDMEISRLRLGLRERENRVRVMSENKIEGV